MKKLLFIAVFSFVGVTAFAQETEEIQEKTTEQIATVQDDFSEVMMDELPEEVTTAIEKNYPNASIDKAYWNGESMKYKLDVGMEDGTSRTLYLGKDGNFLDEQ